MTAELVPLQSGGVGAGNFVNLIGAGILLVVFYHYSDYKRTMDADARQAARRNATLAAIVFVFYSYVVSTYMPYSDAWVAQVGFSAERYFERFGRKLVLVDPASTVGQTPLEGLLGGIRTLGLVAYILFLGATSIAAKTPVLILRRLFG